MIYKGRSNDIKEAIILAAVWLLSMWLLVNLG
jgi:hypothetical protein